jgi:hypothetical protein
MVHGTSLSRAVHLALALSYTAACGTTPGLSLSGTFSGPAKSNAICAVSAATSRQIFQ